MRSEVLKLKNTIDSTGKPTNMNASYFLHHRYAYIWYIYYQRMITLINLQYHRINSWISSNLRHATESLRNNHVITRICDFQGRLPDCQFDIAHFDDDTVALTTTTNICWYQTFNKFDHKSLNAVISLISGLLVGNMLTLSFGNDELLFSTHVELLFLYNTFKRLILHSVPYAMKTKENHFGCQYLCGHKCYLHGII